MFVVAVVVTYNRLNMLKECIDSLLNQRGKSLKKIVIVNNNSNDGTEEYLGSLSNQNDKIIVLNLKENLGGAGGFYVGLKYSFESIPEADWFWLMDDDSEPANDCLWNLLSVVEKNDNVGFVAPKIINKFSGMDQIYHHKLMTYTLVVDKFVSSDILKQKEVINIDANAFVGPLIAKKAVEKVGYPNKDFFIWLDDTEYSFRITRMFNGLLSTKSIIYHKDNPTKDMGINDFWKVCYGYRNRIIWIKSQLKGFRLYISYLNLIYFYLKDILNILLRKKWSKNRFLCIKLLTKSFFYGFKNKNGKFIEPKLFFNAIKK